MERNADGTFASAAPDSIKIVYHHFIGRYTDDPSNPQPIFGDYPGYIRGPFTVTKPPQYRRVPGNPEPEVTNRGEVKYGPNKYFIMIPQGNKYINIPREGWHVEVNVGTEFFPRWAYFENAQEKKYCRSVEGSWFEFVKDEISETKTPEPELAGAPAAGTTQKPITKGK